MLTSYHQGQLPYFQQLIHMKQPSYVLLTFLDYQSLQNLYQFCQSSLSSSSSQSFKPFLNLILSFIFNKKYINKIDRSMLYFMYEDQKIAQQVDKVSILNIAENFSLECSYVMQKYQTLVSLLSQKCNMSLKQTQKLKEIITESDLPLPISLRSNIGKYCNSTYQIYMCSKINQNVLCLDEESYFEEFKNKQVLNEQNNLKSILMQIKQQSQQFNFTGTSILQKLKLFCFNPQTFIQNLSDDCSQDLIYGNNIYNLIVLVMKISKNVVRSMKIQIKSVSEDSYLNFLELLLRFSIYKNYVLQIEQQLGFIFEMYSENVAELFNLNVNNNKRIFNAASMLMKIFRDQLNQQLKEMVPVYINLVHKLKVNSSNTLYQQLGFNEQLNYFDSFDRQEGSFTLHYLLKNNDQFHNFLSDFVELFIDLSINQTNAAWCGHSQHQLKESYSILQNNIIQYQLRLFSKLQTQKLTLQKVIQSELQFLQKSLNFKSRTLKTLCCCLNTNVLADEFEAIDKQIMHINRRLILQFKQDLISSQKSNNSAITMDSEAEISDIDFEDLEYFSEISQDQVYQEMIQF